MTLNHIQLQVKDIELSKNFYKEYFGFRDRIADQEVHFLINDEGFDLAFRQAESIQKMSSFFHFGFRLNSKEEVKEAWEQIILNKSLELTNPLNEDFNYLSFNVNDPDGYNVEVYFVPNR